MDYAKFKKDIWAFYKRNKRDLPWRRTRDPYRILVSEMMLQQTQVNRVIPKYLAFLMRYPTIGALARAPVGDVLKDWQGLGYNRRALALKRTGQIIMVNHRGRIPRAVGELERLPGIGPYTARALCVFAWNQPHLMIETNIRRVYLQYFFPKSQNIADDALLPVIEKTMDVRNPRQWYYALMDCGAALPKLVPNANRRSKHYTPQSKFNGSHRQIRGAVLRTILQLGRITRAFLDKKVAAPSGRISRAVEQLEREGFLRRQGRSIISS